jgi:hypothetical protein
VILLDTNAVLWALVGHPRAAPLWEWRRGLYISPVSMLELRFLLEAGKLREAPGFSLRQVADDPRWSLDSWSWTGRETLSTGSWSPTAACAGGAWPPAIASWAGTFQRRT